MRKARLLDAKEIYLLIGNFSKQGHVLSRSLNDIYENIRDFWVYREKGKLVGTGALHIVGWQNLAEIKSLIVKKAYQKKGIGKKLVGACLKEAKSLGVKQVFVLTFIPTFFEKLGFKRIGRELLPHKIWSECLGCPLFPDCKELALIKTI